MNTVIKPNDIFIAATTAPDIKLEDLYANNITGDNTSFYSYEDYKLTPFVQKKYTQNGVFDEGSFQQDYLKAANLYKAITDKDAEKKFIENEFFYDPQNLDAPFGANRLDPKAIYTKLRNPLEQQVGIEQINTWSDPEKTPEEIAQGNKIFDPKTGQFLNETPEDQKLLDKAFGRTLKYAIWEEQGTHIDPETGDLVMHEAGEWKTDENGKYYTEIMYDEQLGSARVVSFEDILTKEDSIYNKYDFFDSDGYTKSITGTLMKTATKVGMYMIPGFNKFYGAFTAVMGLGEAVPALYKSIESAFTDDKHSELYKTMSTTENWFKKFTPSKSYEGRKGFWNLESMGELVADTFGQIHQQRAAASLSKVFLPEKVNAEGMEDLARMMKRNAMAKNFTLGYMSLLTISDMYNEAKNAGYSDRAAGIASLMSGSLLFGIMKYNETANGLGTWFLDKTTGYNPDIERSALRKALMNSGLVDDIEKGVTAITKQQDVGKWQNLLNSAKKKLYKNSLALAGITESLWKNAIVEGVEEVSEEAVQDAVKGIMDTAAWLGIAKNDTEGFGGWSNVFSKEGISRYLSTFAGGAIGGAIFDAQRKYIEPFFDPSLKEENKDIIEYLVDGQKDLLFKELDNMKKCFNTNIKADIATINGQNYNIAANGSGSEADVIIEGVKQRIQTIEDNLKTTLGPLFTMGSKFLKQDEQSITEFNGIKDTILEKVHKDYITKKYLDLCNEVNTNKENYDKLLKESQSNTQSGAKKESEELLESRTKLEKSIQTVKDFFNGKQAYKHAIAFDIYKREEWRENLSFYGNGDNKVPALDIKSFAKAKYGKEFDEFEEESKDATKITQKTIQEEYDIYSQYDSEHNVFDDQLQVITDLFITEQRLAAPHLKRWKDKAKQQIWIQNLSKSLSPENYGAIERFLIPEQGMDIEALKKEFLKTSDHILERLPNESDEAWQIRKEQYFESHYKDLMGYYQDHTKDFTITDAIDYDLGSILFEKGIISIRSWDAVDEKGQPIKDDKLKEKEEIVKKLINQQFALYNTKGEINQELIQKVLGSVVRLINSMASINIHVQQLLDIQKEQALGDDGGVFLKSILKINETNNIDNSIIEDIKNSQYKTLTEALSKSDVINPELFQHLMYLKNRYVNTIWNTLINAINENLGAIAPDITTDLNIYASKEQISIEEAKTRVILGVLTSDGFKYKNINGEEVSFDGTLLSNLIQSMTEEGGIEPLIDSIKQSQSAKNLLEILKEEQNYKQQLQDPENSNPIHDLINSLARKVELNGKKLKFFEYLLAKELEFNSLPDITLLNLSQQEIEECFKTFAKILRHIRVMLGGNITSIGEDNMPLPSIVSNIREYSKHYLNDTTADQDFIDLENDDVNTIIATINNLENKLEKLRRVYQFTSNQKVKDAYEEKIKIQKAHAKFYKGNQNLFANSPFGIEQDDDDYTIILKAESAIFNYFKDKSHEDKIAFLNKFIEDFKDQLGDNFYTTRDIVTEDGDIDPKFIANRLLAAICMDLKQATSEYVSAIKSQNILYKLDQQLAFEQGLACNIDKKAKKLTQEFIKSLYNVYVPEKDVSIYNDEGDGVTSQTYHQALHDGLMYFGGVAGAGKSAVVGKLLTESLAKLKKSKIVVAAISETKQNDLLAVMPNATKCSLWGDNSFIKTLVDNYDELHAWQTQVLTGIQKAQNVGELEGEIKIDGVGTITLKEVSGGLEIVDLKFDHVPEVKLKKNIETQTIFIDEATMLDPATLYILNKLGLSENIDMLLAGDDLQEGFEIRLEGTIQGKNTELIFPYNLNRIYVNRTPYLTSIFRSNNSGNTRNLNIIQKICSIINHPFKSVSVSENTLQDIKQLFQQNPLHYRDDAELFGHQLVSDDTSFLSQLAKIKTQLDAHPEKTIAVVVGKEANIETVKQQIISAGIPGNNLNIFKEGDLAKNIQGAEYNYVILHSLSRKSNIDVDQMLRSAYMLASRAKDFTLIRENNNHLFTTLGIITVPNYTLSSEQLDNNIIKNFTDKQIEIIENHLSKVGYTTPQVQPKEETKEVNISDKKSEKRKEIEKKRDESEGEEGGEVKQPTDNGGQDNQGDNQDPNVGQNNQVKGEEINTGEKIIATYTKPEEVPGANTDMPGVYNIVQDDQEATEEDSKKLGEMADAIANNPNLFIFDPYHTNVGFDYTFDENNEIVISDETEFESKLQEGKDNFFFYVKYWLGLTPNDVKNEDLKSLISNYDDFKQQLLIGQDRIADLIYECSQDGKLIFDKSNIKFRITEPRKAIASNKPHDAQFGQESEERFLELVIQKDGQEFTISLGAVRGKAFLKGLKANEATLSDKSLKEIEEDLDSWNAHVGKILELQQEIYGEEAGKQFNKLVQDWAANDSLLVMLGLIQSTSIREYSLYNKDNSELVLGVLGKSTEPNPKLTKDQLEYLNQYISNDYYVFNNTEDGKRAFFKWYNSFRVLPLTEEGKKRLEKIFYCRRWYTINVGEQNMPIMADKRGNYWSQHLPKKISRSLYWNAYKLDHPELKSVKWVDIEEAYLSKSFIQSIKTKYPDITFTWDQISKWIKDNFYMSKDNDALYIKDQNEAQQQVKIAEQKYPNQLIYFSEFVDKDGKVDKGTIMIKCQHTSAEDDYVFFNYVYELPRYTGSRSIFEVIQEQNQPNQNVIEQIIAPTQSGINAQEFISKIEAWNSAEDDAVAEHIYNEMSELWQQIFNRKLTENAFATVDDFNTNVPEEYKDDPQIKEIQEFIKSLNC